MLQMQLGHYSAACRSLCYWLLFNSGLPHACHVGQNSKQIWGSPSTLGLELLGAVSAERCWCPRGLTEQTSPLSGHCLGSPEESLPLHPHLPSFGPLFQVEHRKGVSVPWSRMVYVTR